MRIISGSAKGRKLFSPRNQSRTIRPTTDRARESLFNIIGDRIIDSCVLDLFAGTGAFGCEALSRGAGQVIFADNSKISLDLIAKNVNLIADAQARSAVLNCDLSRGLCGAITSRLKNQRIDLVFADPPYLTGLSDRIISSLDNCSVLSRDSLIIIEERKGFSPPETLERLHLLDIRKYGDSSFYFFIIPSPNNGAESHHEQQTKR